VNDRSVPHKGIAARAALFGDGRVQNAGAGRKFRKARALTKL
jgi:hypothetical protein